MQMLNRILLLSLTAISLPAFADVASSIDRVTLYPGNMAEIERVAEVELHAGQGELVFAGLPAALIDGSVQVSIEDNPSVLIGGVEVAREPVGEPPRERQRELENRIEQLLIDQRVALDRVAAAGNEITFIEGLAELPKGEKAAEALMNEAGAENWQALWERIGAGSRQARERLRTAERQAADIQEEIDLLKRKLAQLGQSRPQVVNLTVPYRSEADSTAEFRLSYRVRGPSWQPQYEIRLDTSAGKVTLIRTARVVQATGEDWRDVQLALSTSQPVYGERPELTPWWIDIASEIKPLPRRIDKAVMMNDIVAEGAVAQAAAPPPSQTINAEFAATYIINGRVTVPGNNEERELPIGQHDVEVTIGAETTPQINPHAWLIAAATWNGEGPLPAGPVARFRDSAYIGEGNLESWAPGEERTLAFGIDPQIEVSFRPTKDEAGESGWITTSSTLIRNYNLEITNHHSRNLPVTALIRIPVPKNEAITVETDFSVEPSKKDVDDDKGVYAWTLDLGAGESKNLQLGYEIRYPEGKELSGI